MTVNKNVQQFLIVKNQLMKLIKSKQALTIYWFCFKTNLTGRGIVAQQLNALGQENDGIGNKELKYQKRCKKLDLNKDRTQLRYFCKLMKYFYLLQQ